jgi:hypothetical protein
MIIFSHCDTTRTPALKKRPMMSPPVAGIVKSTGSCDGRLMMPPTAMPPRKKMMNRSVETAEEARIRRRSILPRMIYEMLKQMKKTLGQMQTWLEAASNFAQKKSFDPNVFLGMRLAPDQFAFARQVQTACDTAKLAAARMSGKEAPKHPDTEQTIDELRTRVGAVIKYLEGFSAKDFEGAETRVITQPRWEGKVMSGGDYFLEHAVPNFFFHTVHTYAILRHAGVDIGKKDFLGALSQRTP